MPRAFSVALFVAVVTLCVAATRAWEMENPCARSSINRLLGNREMRALDERHDLEMEALRHDQERALVALQAAYGHDPSFPELVKRHGLYAAEQTRQLAMRQRDEWDATCHRLAGDKVPPTPSVKM